MRLKGISKQALGRIAKSVKGQEEDKVFEPAGHPWDMADKLREVLGDEQFINELLKAMSHEEAVENLQFIAQNWDISLSDREEY